MKTVPLPRAMNQQAKQDPHYPAAVERAKGAVRRLQKAGIIDAEGRRIRTDLPADMKEGQDRAEGTLPKPSWLKISQVRTISIERIGKRIGGLDSETMSRALDGLLDLIE